MVGAKSLRKWAIHCIAIKQSLLMKICLLDRLRESPLKYEAVMTDLS